MIYTVQTRLGEINWDALQPGDEVRIPYRVAPYAERLRFSARGTKDARITVRGMPGPNGELPRIVGKNAVTDPQFVEGYLPIETYGLIVVYHSSPTRIPGYVDFIGLDVSGASADTGIDFTGYQGIARKWANDASGFYLLEFENVRIIGCSISDCGNGIFSHDGHTGTDLLIENNDLSGCGKVGSTQQHTTYIQCVRPVYRGNRYGPHRAGSGGGSLKDRSADVLIEGNFIRGGARQIDLSGWQNEIAARAAAPNAGRVVIQNNVVLNKDGECGSVSFIYSEAGRGTTLVQSSRNTYLGRRTQASSYYLRPFWLEYAGTEITSDHDIIDVTGSEARLFDGSQGTLKLGATWASKAFSLYGIIAGHVTGTENVTIGEPGYIDEAAGNYFLKDTAAAKGYGASGTSVPVPIPSPVPLPEATTVIIEVGGKRFEIQAKVIK